MKAVVGYARLGKYRPCYQHHGRGEVQCYLFHLKAFMKGNLLDYGNHGFGLRAMYDGHQSARTSVPVLVGQECIDLTAAQAGFVNAQMRAYVLGIDQVLRGMAQLFPPAEVAEMFLVLGAEKLAVHPIMVGYAIYALGCALNPLLLKKQQTRGRVWSRVPSSRRNHK